jgi:hypothetical protein
MPYWLEAIINDVPDEYIHEFKSLFDKMFDPVMTSFTMDQMYHFASERFDGTSSTIQEQSLSWLQILCELDVNIPISLLLRMFHTSLNSLQKLETRVLRRQLAYLSSNDYIEQDQYNQFVNNNAFTVFDTYEAYRVYRNQLMLQQITGQELARLIKEEEEDFIINNSELNITCCIMMLDMIIKQLELQRIPMYLTMNNLLSKDIVLLLSKQLILPWIKKHKCKQQYGFLSAESVGSMNPGGSTSGAPNNANTSNSSTFTAPASSSNTAGNSSANNYCVFCEEYVLWFTFAKDILIHLSSKHELDIPEVNYCFLLEKLNAKKLKVQKSDSCGGGGCASGSDVEQTIEEIENELKHKQSTPKKSQKTDPDVGIWVTTYGVYYFKLPQLQPQLQLFYSILKQIFRVPDVDAFYNVLVCLKLLIINNECLETANRDQKGFLIYCLEKLLIPT